MTKIKNSEPFELRVCNFDIVCDLYFVICDFRNLGFV